MQAVSLLKLQETAYFNPNYLIPDRILNSTEVFTAIHHKRANDIKGKWQESILNVSQKLINFIKKGYPYGTLFTESMGEQEEKKYGISGSISIGQILNKIYLGIYQHNRHFWYELGKAINIYLTVHTENSGDYHIAGMVIKEAAIFLYIQWYHLLEQRF